MDLLLGELRLRAVLVQNVPTSFTYARDPSDAHYVNLAVATKAMLVVSRDRNCST
ncbi:MAG TPA: hypothetical protein VER17_02400 [Tepidisphaeraceae bacterium]|nr:hypothetical protein [Tepidisphaeraceae bacterium]